MDDSRRFRTTLGLFVVSGAAGLVDQVCFSKYLVYIVGSTAYAVSAVLAAFMAGLALGSFLGGKLAGRIERPLFAYGVLEILVAISVALAPFGFAALTPLYVSAAQSVPGQVALLSILRWGLAISVVLVPTLAMGATLPLLSGLVASRGVGPAEREMRLGRLYAANTLGGAVGSIAAAYGILPALGLRGTVWLGATASLVVGCAAMALGSVRTVVREQPSPAAADSPSPDGPPRTDAPPHGGRVLALLALASGWLVFAAEVVFTHLLALVIGNSAYAFGLILAVFLSCLFVGAVRAPQADARFGPSALPLGLGATAVALMVTLPLWALLPELFPVLGSAVTSFAGRELVRALIAFAILVVPTTLMGLTFPLLLIRVAREGAVSAKVGHLTAVNTLGAVAGALSTGYLVLPLLGSERSVAAIAFAFAAASLMVSGARRDRRVLTLALAAALSFLLLPRWDLARITSGSNVYFSSQKRPDEVLFVREDVHGGITTVTRKDGVKRLTTNGKFQGDDGKEMPAQRLFAHYPSLFVRHFEQSLVIGLGTGTTLGTVLTYPWQRVHVAEISPAMVDAAAAHFERTNLGALLDPRVTVILDDARNYLLVTRERYDFISMELSSIWFAGAASLYSREYYSLVSEHLSPGGIFQQWVQLHHVKDAPFVTILNTLHQEFPHVALFVGGQQGILVASHEPLLVSKRHLEELERTPAVRATVPEARTVESLLDDVVLAGAGFESYLAETARKVGQPLSSLVSTDDNLYLEYETPKGNVMRWAERDAFIEGLRRYRSDADIARLEEP